MSRQNTDGGRFEAPARLPAGPLEEGRLRQELVSLKSHLCEDLIYTASIILNSGILSAVPARIQELTGMRVDELEHLETRACLETAGDAQLQGLTTAELFDEVRTIEWLVKLHLAAMADVTERAPRLRPIDAEGSFAAFFELHDVIIGEMRRSTAALQQETTLEEARSFGAFWHDVVLTHAQAEDRALWPLARSLDDPGITRSADLLETEHTSIDEQVAGYMEMLEWVEQEGGSVAELVPIGRDIRGRVELHFAKEEESVIRLLQSRVSDDQFRRVVMEQEAAIGPWLKAHGWSATV